MVKLLPMGLVVLAMVSVVLYLRFFRFAPPPVEPAGQISTVQETPAPPAREVSTLTPVPVPAKPANSLPAAAGGQSSAALEARVNTLETALAAVQSQLQSLQQTTGIQPTSTTTKKPPAYIPLGSGGSWNDQNYLSLNSYEASIDPGEYEGYSGMQLEVNLRLVQAAGTAYARLYNVTDSSAIGTSEVSTISDKAVLLTSASFKLPAGRKTYRLQVKSTYGFIVEITTARIKVNF